jgi:uncharacterized Zn-binding protein involved in type VI secretion
MCRRPGRGDVDLTGGPQAAERWAAAPVPGVRSGDPSFLGMTQSGTAAVPESGQAATPASDGMPVAAQNGRRLCPRWRTMDRIRSIPAESSMGSTPTRPPLRDLQWATIGTTPCGFAPAGPVGPYPRLPGGPLGDQLRINASCHVGWGAAVPADALPKGMGYAKIGGPQGDQCRVGRVGATSGQPSFASSDRLPGVECSAGVA